MYFLSTYIIQALCGIIIITLHGFLTAFISFKLGDSTPQNRGMVTLNPIKHFEPLGFIIYVLFGYGWGQPVPTSVYGYKNKRAGCVLTALLPVIIEVALGYALVLAQYTPLPKAAAASNALTFAARLGSGFVCYGLYNLIPVYPLNGHKLLLGVLPPNSAIKYNELEKILQLVLVFLIFMGIVNKVIGFIYYLPLRLVLGW